MQEVQSYTKTYSIANPASCAALARQLLAQAEELRIWCFKGELGAGKTTLIKALCQALGVTTTVTSPTFSLIHSYPTPTGEEVYHADLYRLETPEEAIKIGFETYLTGDEYLFIEWPDIINSLLPPHYFTIEIDAPLPSQRTIYAYPSST